MILYLTLLCPGPHMIKETLLLIKEANHCGWTYMECETYVRMCETPGGEIDV